jgi:hypothetical protein
MAKITTKKGATSFQDGITAILLAHGIEVPTDRREKLLSDMLYYFNDKYKPDNKVKHWNECVTLYFTVYRNITDNEPAFLGNEARALKEVSNTLMSRYLKKNINGIWDVETCIRQHEIFYSMITTIPFVKQNFSIAFVANNFDKITSQLSAKK